MNIGAATPIGQGPTFRDRIVIHVTKCIHLLWSNVMLALCQKLNHRNAGIFGPQHACKPHVLRRRVRRASKWCVLEAIRKWFLLWQRMSSSPFKIYDSFKSKKYLKNWIRLWFGVHNTNDHRKTFSSYFCLFLFELVHEQHNQDTAIDRQFGCASIYLNSVSRPLNLYFYQKLIPFGWKIDGYKQQFWRKFTEMCLSCIIFRICILKCFSECSRIVFYVGLFQVNRHKFWGGYGKCAMIAIVSAMSHWSLDWIWIIIYVWVCRSYRSRCFVSTSSMQIVNCTRYP